MKKIFFAIAIMLFTTSAFAQNRDELVNNYIHVKDALVNSDSKAASEAAAALHQLVKDEGDFTQRPGLLKATEKLSRAANLESQRAVFNEVSVVLWKAVKDMDKVSEPVYYQYCPMKKAYWLSKEEKIKNPYYGSSMLTCGKVVETKS